MTSLVLAAAVSWPVQYNDGVTVYRSNDFSTAATTFEQATASPDRALQQRAFYNLGNAAYRLGEADQTKAQFLWERAVKSYEAALALDPKDDDAKFNRDFVKKKLEELKKRQEQQQKQQNQQDKQDKEKEQHQDQKQPEQKKQPQQQNQDQKQQEEQQQAQPDSHKDANAQDEQKRDESKPHQQEERASQVSDFDKQQAKALLDNLREDERNWNFFPEVQMKDLKDSGEAAKDW